MNKIYFDNAATTKMSPDVIEVMHQVMQSDFGNPSSIHSYGRTARTIIEKSRKTVAEILNASTGEIFFTSSATESNNMAIFRSVIDLGVRRIITSATEHPCVLNSVKSVHEHHPEVEIAILDVDQHGELDLEHLEKILSSGDQKTLVSIMHGNNEIGTIHDIKAISKICSEHSALYHCDTVQTIGKFQLDLQDLNINFLSGSGHKIYGPKGVGIIYVNQDNMINAMLKGGGQERQLRSGTENVYGIAGFAKALELLDHNKTEHNQQVTLLRKYLKEELVKHVDGVAFNGSKGSNYLPHVLNLSIPKSEKTELIMFNLDINGICASAGSACSSGTEQRSHVLNAIRCPQNRKSLRFSLCPQNTTDEIDVVVSKLKEII